MNRVELCVVVGEFFFFFLSMLSMKWGRCPSEQNGRHTTAPHLTRDRNVSQILSKCQINAVNTDSEKHYRVVDDVMLLCI